MSMETHKYDTLRIRKQEAVKFETIREKDIAIDIDARAYCIYV